MPVCTSRPQGPIPAVNTENSLAVKGYDPVAYFTQENPTPGDEAYSLRWRGAVYRFASRTHLELFQAEPDRYQPQYGGYCAYAMAVDRLADINPDRWSIIDGRLYLNANRLAQFLWVINPKDNIESADQHWSSFPKAAP